MWHIISGGFFSCSLTSSRILRITHEKLQQRFEEHHLSTVGKHLESTHGVMDVTDLTKQFIILRECSLFMTWGGGG